MLQLEFNLKRPHPVQEMSQTYSLLLSISVSVKTFGVLKNPVTFGYHCNKLVIDCIESMR